MNLHGNLSKSVCGHRGPQGFTRIELIVIIGLIFLAFLYALGCLGSSRARRSRINCANNLRQVSIAVRLWANDNQERFPWSSTNLDAKILEPYAYCLLATNELKSPKVLVCPTDKGRTPALAFDLKFSNNNMSYFFGLDADETRPQTIVSGDRNLSTNNRILSGLVKLQGGTKVGWAPGLHSPVGNVALGDGSSQQIGPGFVLPVFGTNGTGSHCLLIP
jgi:hypothetical protein